MNEILESLNTKQQEAVKNIYGPMLILAGAGSGKTKVLTCRIAWLLEKGVAPWKILAITFTNKAAAEMRTRVDKLVGVAAKDVWLHTFHAFCAKFLRYEIDNLKGYTNRFAIYDTADTKILMKECLNELELDDKQYPISMVLSRISNAKNKMQSAKDFAKEAEDFHSEKIAEIYSLYEKKLFSNNALDFDDLLLLTIKILKENEEIRAKYQEKFEFVMVDEYQDTNYVQYLLAKILTEKSRNLCVVGDIDQSIYGWRGADISNILNFEKDFEDAKIVKLEQNYRSTKVILDAANNVIENNEERKPKNLWTQKDKGEPITVYQASDERDEARFVVEQIAKMRDENEHSVGDIAILYRMNTQSRVFEEMLIKAGISYTIVGGTKFYERKEIKDIMAYLKLIYNNQDTLSLRRIINVPRRGIGGATIAKLENHALTSNLDMFDVITNSSEVPSLSSRFINKLEDFSTTLFELIGMVDEVPIDEFLEAVMDKTGYIAELENEKTAQAEARKENLQELISVAKEFGESDEEKNLENFLNHVALVSDIDTANLEEEKVTLMTLHSSKGLEFPVVFLVGMEDGIFPTQRVLADKDGNKDGLEEERRLCYVGITRAQERLFLSYARMRMLYGHTVMYPESCFLKEIPEGLINLKKREIIRVKKTENDPNDKKKKRPSYDWSVSSNRKGFTPRMEGNSSSQNDNFNAGDKVLHSKWGSGTVVSVRDNGDSQEVKVAFAGVGIRSLLTKYAILKKL